jgi:hypothetical protein
MILLKAERRSTTGKDKRGSCIIDFGFAGAAKEGAAMQPLMPIEQIESRRSRTYPYLADFLALTHKRRRGSSLASISSLPKNPGS